MGVFTREGVVNDIATAAERMGLDIEDLQEMIVDVLDDCIVKTEAILKAIQEGDVTRIKAIAHDIKGSTANYGLVQPSSLALEIERHCESLPTKPTNELLEQLKELKTLDLDRD